MPDRLQELLHQKALLREHLAWLDQEIAAHSATEPPSPQPVAAAPGRSTPTVQLVSGDAPEAERIMEQYRASSAEIPGNVKKGCILYFVIAMVLLGFGVTAIWLSARR